MLLSCLGGGVLGWLANDQWHPDGNNSDMVQNPVAVAFDPAPGFPNARKGDREGDAYVGSDAAVNSDVTGQVARLYESGQLMSALELLLVSDRLPQSPEERQERMGWLEVVLDAIERQLTEDRRPAAYDPVLESVILAMPDQWRYFFQLGEFRVQHGDDNGAARVLSQIENHPDYGPDARRLLAMIDQRKQDEVRGAVSIPLIPHRGQFLVPCRIGNTRVNLLLDTGAALTVLSTDQARRSGLPVGDEVRYFATAGGVIQAPVVVADEFTLGEEDLPGEGATINQLSVGLIDIPFSQRSAEVPVDGLLGMNVLGRFRFRLDQQAPALELLPLE